MKIYNLVTYRSYRVFGQTITPETDLFGRTWIVFDEEGKDEVITFQKNGVVSQKKGNGSLTTGKWSFEEGVKRLHVELGKLDFVCIPVEALRNMFKAYLTPSIPLSATRPPAIASMMSTVSAFINGVCICASLLLVSSWYRRCSSPQSTVLKNDW